MIVYYFIHSFIPSFVRSFVRSVRSVGRLAGQLHSLQSLYCQERFNFGFFCVYFYLGMSFNLIYDTNGIHLHSSAMNHRLILPANQMVIVNMNYIIGNLKEKKNNREISQTCYFNRSSLSVDLKTREK